MTEKNLNALAISPSTRKEPSSITTMPLFEEHPTPAAMGAEAPPAAVSLDLSASGPFGAY
ncbi:MAG TPA: hypothetical protein VFB76_00140 [Candidatus Angelobacter sp.]|nr:hypothetical protein [Candidatus Angelobacter sp.]